ncbi:hypothetical protein MIND_01099000 [Mycena indigotica]|uniref:Uncharacterized protein n=1 Tax=Mycena indigotica TaxID=2126181 RepID=A0A8H6SB98_9AGAR|nr:uncharacterized protein MIND_01099000 [Mycena indigotica]KAF7295590.1 hypothetical protein MIND_01099000 [Mycena indigotica]
MSQTEGPSKSSAAADAARREQFAKHVKRHPLNTVVPGSEGWTSPAFRIFLESNTGSREEVQPGHRYYPIHAHILTAFNHLLASDRAKEIISAMILTTIAELDGAPILHPTEEDNDHISVSDVEEALKTGMPNVFIRTLAKPTKSGPPTEFPWGMISVENNTIELSLSKELCDVLCPMTPVPNAALRASFELILLLTIEHELVHVLIKLFFGLTFIMPRLPCFQEVYDTSGDRIAESGATFEASYMGVQIQAEWTLPLDEPNSNGFPNLEKMAGLVARVLPWLEVFPLEPQDVHNLLASFSSDRLWILRLKQLYLPLPQIDINRTLRYSVSLESLENEEEEPELNNQQVYRSGSCCGTHSLHWSSSHRVQV